MRLMSKEKFYGSKLHRDTEASYREYVWLKRQELAKKGRILGIRHKQKPRNRLLANPFW